MLSYLIGGSFVATPFIFRFTGNLSTLRMSKEIFLFFALMLFVFFYEKVNEIDFKIKLSLITLICFSFIHTQIFASSVWWRQFQFFASGIVFLYILLTARIDFNIIKKSLMILCLIESFWTILSIFNIEFYNVVFSLFFEKVVQIRDGFYNMGSLGNPNLSGALISITAPLFFSRKHWVGLIPIVVALVAGGSIMPLITFIAGFCYFIWLNLNLNKYVPYLLFLIAGLFFIMVGFPEGYLSDNSRLEAWKKTILFLDNFIFGKGLGHFSAFFSRSFVINGEYFRNTHNEYLQVLYNFGLVGFSIFSYLFVSLLRRKEEILISCCIFAIAVNCYGNFLFHISLTAFVALTIFAIGYRSKEINE